jgi:hypothetical protein
MGLLYYISAGYTAGKFCYKTPSLYIPLTANAWQNK